jgi:hypothetical protein
MYFPYLRGKQFELETLIALPMPFFGNTLPILEPISLGRRKLYTTLAREARPLILIVNPQYPNATPLNTTILQGLIDTELATHPALTLGFIIDQRFSAARLNTFLASNPERAKALIFRNNPIPADLAAIQAAIATQPVQIIIFDESRTSVATRNIFNAHPYRVLLTDGFQRQVRNSDYPGVSVFASNYNSWVANGWQGIGDYLTVGDYFQDGGGPAYVVTLHLTVQHGANLLVHHFSSTVHATVQTFTAAKFHEANGYLVGSPYVVPLNSTGLDLYRDWHARVHNPQLGQAKKASMLHHIELMSTIV